MFLLTTIQRCDDKILVTWSGESEYNCVNPHKKLLFVYYVTNIVKYVLSIPRSSVIVIFVILYGFYTVKIQSFI